MGPLEKPALRDLTSIDERQPGSRKFSNFLPELCIAVQGTFPNLKAPDELRLPVRSSDISDMEN